MAGVDKLTGIIIRDGQQEASKIEDEAKAKSAVIYQECDKRIESMRERRQREAAKRADDRYDRIISKAALDSRNALVAAKQRVIETAFHSALERIENMDASEYPSFLADMLLNNVECGDEEVILSASDKKRISPALLDDVNGKLLSQNRVGMLKWGGESDIIACGFILKKGGVEINCDIGSRLKMLRDDLEGEIASILFD